MSDLSAVWQAFATSLASDGLAADSQSSWHLQMVLPGRRDRADVWTCSGLWRSRTALRRSPRVLRIFDNVDRADSAECAATERWHVYRSLHSGYRVM